MRVYCIACGVFRTDLEELLPSFPMEIEVKYMEGGLHSHPDLLRKELQMAIDSVKGNFERIVLLYGICGRGTVGLHSKHYPLVIPKVHDCISMFLGGSKEYRKQFSHKPGTYYISAGWYEEQVQPRGDGKSNKQSIEFPKKYLDTMDENILKDRLGTENSEFVTSFFNQWKKNYSRAVFIDTGSGRKKVYSDYAKLMAKENNWEFKKLNGTHKLIRQCFAPDSIDTNDDILVVPPGKEIILDPASGLLKFASSSQKPLNQEVRTIIIEPEGQKPAVSEKIHKSTLGLGIDAGGTYTDAVLYDFNTSKIVSRSKALTTKWRYSEGIINAVRQLPANFMHRVDLVSLSTTLVTNAIVESNIYPVGLLIMPLAKPMANHPIHEPNAVIQGNVAIDGTITQDIDPEEIRKIAHKMIEKDGVRSFAVSGYGGSVNPALELRVKAILRESTGLDVCCGHELSETLNLYVRAHTAVLNAGVIPIMEEFLKEMKKALSELGLNAPHLVVKGDGSVITSEYASEFPVQTALSGPAASMAGAKHLTNLENALIIDVGGTTSDIGLLKNGSVSICEDGATIGSWKTHLKSVDMLTTGLGGDSAISYDRGIWSIGPERITPFCWLDSQFNLDKRLKITLERSTSESSTIPFQWFYSTGKTEDFTLNKQEKEILKILKDGPHTISELGFKLSNGAWELLKTNRLEKSYCIQRAGLTPTDMYHIQNKLILWKSKLLRSYFNLILSLQNKDGNEIIEFLNRKLSRIIGNSVLRRIFPNSHNKTHIYQSILDHGNSLMSLSPKLNIPLVGLGAIAPLVLKDAAKILKGDLIIPGNGDVANALGAITSKISVKTSASIILTNSGHFRITGMDVDDDFEELEEAENQCINLLASRTRKIGEKSGTSNKRVNIRIVDKTAESANGESLFLERQFVATLEGIPDLV